MSSPVNRCVLRSRLKCSEPTAGSRRSGSEFQTVGPATEKARLTNVLRTTLGTDSWRYLAELDAGDRELQTQVRSSRRDNLEPVNDEDRPITMDRHGVLWRTVSQCRSSCVSRDRPRSYYWVSVIRRAAAFRTELVCESLQRRSHNRVIAVIDLRACISVLTHSTSNERRSRLTVSEHYDNRTERKCPSIQYKLKPRDEIII